MHRATLLTLHEGPAHVLVAVNDRWRMVMGAPPLGAPVEETFIEPGWEILRAAMDGVYRTGMELEVEWESGRCVIVRRARGVATAFLPAPRTGVPCPPSPGRVRIARLPGAPAERQRVATLTGS
jgi:hypothetical protein